MHTFISHSLEYHVMCTTDNSKVNTILDLYRINDSHRDSRLWFLDELDANSYEDYHKNIPIPLSKDHILLLFVVSLNFLGFFWLMVWWTLTFTLIYSTLLRFGIKRDQL